MSTIYYGLSGEGHGHAARARVLVEALRERHRIVICTYGDAWDLLAPVYAGSDVEVRRIPGLRFRYGSRGQLNYAATGLAAAPYLARLPERVVSWARHIHRDRADLVISDLEPLVARAAQLAGVPLVAVDHQHFLVNYDLSGLPLHLQLKASVLGQFVHMMCSGQRRTIVSAFFFPPLRSTDASVTSAGVLLGGELRRAVPEQGKHLVAYVRRRAPREVLDALHGLGQAVRVYGHELRGRSANLEFLPIDPFRFVADLAQSRGLISSVGNQVIGEALALRKPVLAYPEPSNWEQEINGHFLEQSGMGRSLVSHLWTAARLRRFVDELPQLSAAIEPHRMNGNHVVLGAIENELTVRTKESSWNASCPYPEAY